MMKQTWIQLLALGSCVLLPALSVGACGSSDVGSPPGSSSGGDGASDGVGGSENEGGQGENGACVDAGFDCDEDSDCCSDSCDPMAHLCSRGLTCKAAGESCSSGLDCCGLSCLDSTCSSSQCTSDGESCEDGDECCGGRCENDTCVPLNDACSTSGNECTGHTDCCSNYCQDGHCGQPSYCTQSGDTCMEDSECCAGLCVLEEGAALGVCQLAPASGAGGCLTAGEVCSGGAVYEEDGLPTCGGECCSRACFPHGKTGVLICQPPSGCNPTGELCREDSDCCGSEGLPDGEVSQIKCSKEPGAELGRCNAGNSCTPAGGICRLQDLSCNANANCCSGNVLQEDTCKQDNLGIPRCLSAEVDCSDPTSYAGKECATSADCCNLPCVPNPEGTPQLICGAACVDDGETCTTTADCCKGFSCRLKPGSTSGTCGAEEPPPPTDDGTGGSGNSDGSGGGATEICSEYGQSCTETADCCNGVPCTGGSCLQPIR